MAKGRCPSLRGFAVPCSARSDINPQLLSFTKNVFLFALCWTITSSLGDDDCLDDSACGDVFDGLADFVEAVAVGDEGRPLRAS